MCGWNGKSGFSGVLIFKEKKQPALVFLKCRLLLCRERSRLFQLNEKMKEKQPAQGKSQVQAAF